MNKLLSALCLTVVTIVSIFSVSAQTPVDYKKNEFFVGYSNQQVDNGRRRNFNGFEAAYTRNVSRYFGIKGDVSGAYKNQTFNIGFGAPLPANGYNLSFDASDSVYNVLGGVQIKDNQSKARFKPFAHLLVGVGHNRSKSTNPVCTSGNCPVFAVNSFGGTSYNTGLAGAFGGGLDIKINEHIDFRAIQVDYNPVQSTFQTSNNVRFGIGFVFK